MLGPWREDACASGELSSRFLRYPRHSGYPAGIERTTAPSADRVVDRRARLVAVGLLTNPPVGVLAAVLTDAFLPASRPIRVVLGPRHETERAVKRGVIEPADVREDCQLELRSAGPHAAVLTQASRPMIRRAPYVSTTANRHSRAESDIALAGPNRRKRPDPRNAGDRASPLGVLGTGSSLS
jgi:hypothetical protein